MSRGFAWIHNHVTLNCFLLETTFIIDLSIVFMSRWSVLSLVHKVHLLQSIINTGHQYNAKLVRYFFLLILLALTSNKSIAQITKSYPPLQKQLSKK